VLTVDPLQADRTREGVEVRGQLRRFAILLAILMAPGSPVWAAQGHPACPIDQTPSFFVEFAALREQLGATMGEPIECEHVDSKTGDAQQRTTTGLALYRRDTNTAMYTNGREHWALTARGLAHWSGWHGDATPMRAALTGRIEGAEELTTPSGPYPSVEGVTVVDILDERGQRLVVHREATPYLIEVEDGCAPGRPSAGNVIFIVSSGAFAGQDSRIILQLGGLECRITEGHPL
jgi:hypothetical protein